MKKKQVLVAVLPAVVMLGIILFNVFAQSKINALYRNATQAANAKEYDAARMFLTHIEMIAPDYVPQYELQAQIYLKGDREDLARSELLWGIEQTGSKRLISMLEQLKAGTLTVETSSGEDSALPETKPEDWLTGPSTVSAASDQVMYTSMNYNFIVRYTDSQMENTVQLSVEADENAANWNWSSSNPAVATVDENGVLTCENREGEAKITARNADDEVAECWVCVIEPGIYSQDEISQQNYGYYSDSEYFYIPEGNLNIGLGNQGMDEVLEETRTGSTMEILPRNVVRGDGLTGTADLAYTAAGGASAADMVDQNGFPIYKEQEAATPETAAEQGGTIELEMGWQSLYFSGEYRIPEHLRFNGVDYTTTSVNFTDGQSKIQSLYLPATVTDIHEEWFNPFQSYTELESITVEQGNPAYQSVDGALLTADGTQLIAFPVASPKTEYSIPEGVTVISSGAFCNNQNLTTLHIPASVTEIGQGALNNLQSLTDITLDSNNTAFKMVDGVLMNADGTQILAAVANQMPEEYTIPAQVQWVNEDVFKNNDRVKVLTVDASLSSLSLWNSTGLEKLVVNGEMGYLNYSGTESALKEVEINGAVETMSLTGSDNRISLTLNAQVQGLSANNCLVDIVHPENIVQTLAMQIDEQTDITLPGTLIQLRLDMGEKTVPDLRMLESCTGLESLSLSNGGVEDLSALASLPNLTQLYISGVKTEDFDSVWNCTGLTTLRISTTDSLKSLEGIQALTEVTDVNFNGTQIEDVTPLASCSKLVTIELSACENVTDVSALENLPSLQSLLLFGSGVPQETVEKWSGANLF